MNIKTFYVKFLMTVVGNLNYYLLKVVGFVIFAEITIKIQTVMYTTYHLSSAQEISIELLEAIKVAFKSKPITITVEEENDDDFLTTEMKTILNDRVMEDECDFLSANQSIEQLKTKYGI